MKKLIILPEYKTDKLQYANIYEPLFAEIYDDHIKLLELGVSEKGSLYMWRDYFVNGEIYGVDVANVGCGDGVSIFQCDQSDANCLEKTLKPHSPFDIIIDDASHIGRMSKISFDYLFFNLLKPGGLYIIEDWGTGYWRKWDDGEYITKPSVVGKRIMSHDYGMVGFLKSLIDYIGIQDATCEHGVPPQQGSSIKEIRIMKSIAIIYKQ